MLFIIGPNISHISKDEVCKLTFISIFRTLTMIWMLMTKTIPWTTFSKCIKGPRKNKKRGKNKRGREERKIEQRRMKSWRKRSRSRKRSKRKRRVESSRSHRWWTLSWIFSEDSNLSWRGYTLDMRTTTFNTTDLFPLGSWLIASPLTTLRLIGSFKLHYLSW